MRRGLLPRRQHATWPTAWRAWASCSGCGRSSTRPRPGSARRWPSARSGSVRSIPDTADALANLADVLHARGDYAAAAEQHRQVLRIRRRALGDLHPWVAYSLVSLGGALLQQGDRDGRGGGPPRGAEHPAAAPTARSTRRSRRAFTTSRRRSRARATSRARKPCTGRPWPWSASSRAMSTRTWPWCWPTWPTTWPSRDASRMPHRSSSQAAELQRRVIGADHPLLARTLERQAAALVDQGRPAKRCRCSTSPWPSTGRVTATRTRRWPRALATAAKAQGGAGRPRRGREALPRGPRRAAAGASRAPRRHRGDLGGAGRGVGRQGRPAEAEPLLREAMSQADRSLPGGHWRRGEVESALGANLWQLGRTRRGGPLLTSGYERLRRALGDEHPATRRARRRRAVAHEPAAAPGQPAAEPGCGLGRGRAASAAGRARGGYRPRRAR